MTGMTTVWSPTIGDVTLPIDAQGNAALAAITAQSISAPAAITSTTPPVTRVIESEITLSGATVAVAGAGSITPFKGGVKLNSGSHLTSGFLYGAEGKVTLAGNVDNGSGYDCGVLAQMDTNGATLTSGHIAPLIVNIQNPVASALLNGIYVESSGPAVINSVLQSIVNSSFVLDLSPDSGTSACISGTGSAGTTTAKGWLKIQINAGAGALTRYIPLSDTGS